LDSFTGTISGTIAAQAVNQNSEVTEGVEVSDGDRTHDHWSHNPDQQPKKRD